MARLAAYYQEDFHYPSTGSAHKQRKASYVVYEEPKNNVFNSYSFNRGRIRGLAASEPILGHPQMRQELMAHKQKVYHNQAQMYQNHPYHFENVPNTPTSNHQFVGYEPEVFDNESMLSYAELPTHDNRYYQRFRSRPRKRFSYAEPSGLYSPERMYMPQNVDAYHTKQSLENLYFQYYNDGQYQADNCFVEPNEQCQNSSPAYLRPESRQGNWQKHPFIHTNANPVFLSPPSPRDSGLSSQSIGSSPSLDAEPVPEFYPMRSGRLSACSCARMTYCENPHLNNHDYGRTSPGGYSVSHRPVAQTPIYKNGTSNRRKYSSEDYDNMSQQCKSQVRYGKLGLIGEPTTDNRQRAADIQDLVNSNNQHEHDPRDRIRYVYSDESDVSQRKTSHRQKKSPSNKYTRPCVIVIDRPEKNRRPLPSPDREDLSDDKSQGPESPMSVTVSNSDSATSSTCGNELDEQRQQQDPTPTRQTLDKTAESEIKELEDMYKRCNLGDRDLLDRAERRDLPTAHQQSRHRLIRSRSSDALCETLRNNPYEPIRRAPPVRRSGMPDRIADDMALRKLHRPHSSSSRHRNLAAENTVTYMLCSAHFTPTIPPPGRDLLMMDNPDIELDDMCYRKHYLGKECKQDPQPPFGIPLRPPPPQKVNISDYLNVVPSRAPQPLCHPRGNPDVVRDDMAFRTLRKDEPERVYYDISQVYRHKKS